MASNANQSVLLTGVTSQLGSSTLPLLLSSNYTVICVLRSIEKSALYLRNKYPSQTSSNQLSFLEIPDLAIEGVFDDPAEKADYIIHIATPLSTSNFEKEVIEPTLAITENILTAAARKEGRVKRVVICSSLVTVLPLSSPTVFSSPKIYSKEDFSPITLEEGKRSRGGAYCYAKTRSELQAWSFMSSPRLKFDLVTLCAPSILGRNLQECWRPGEGMGGTALFYKNVFCGEEWKGLGIFPFVMDVEDVADAHVKALDRGKVPSGRYLLAIKEKIEGGKVRAFVRENWGDLRGRVGEGDGDGDGGNEREVKCGVDTREAERVFGGERWKGWEECVRGTVEGILEWERANGEDVWKL